MRRRCDALSPGRIVKFGVGKRGRTHAVPHLDQDIGRATFPSHASTCKKLNTQKKSVSLEKKAWHAENTESGTDRSPPPTSSNKRVSNSCPRGFPSGWPIVRPQASEAPVVTLLIVCRSSAEQSLRPSPSFNPPVVIRTPQELGFKI